MFESPELSLADLFGEDYMGGVADAAALLLGMTRNEARELAHRRVDFYPRAMQEADDALLDRVGVEVVPPLRSRLAGAPTDAFARASNLHAAPLGGRGWARIGEDGRLYLAAKSEHYHAPLGHNFPGYQLIDIARRLGVDNAVHNNTRGYMTRVAEREIVRAVNGLQEGEEAKLAAVLASRAPKVLNRLINLETGSLAVEAGIKMMLARFYRLETGFPEPRYAGKTPVFLVMMDQEGGAQANYHGTTVTAQMFRGMWPEYLAGLERAGLMKVVPVRINDPADFEEKVERYNQGEYKTAGFLHEIILMNYGGIRLAAEYLRLAYDACRRTDTPVLVDEIQSCMWYSGMFLFRHYGLDPDFVIIGKGFPGGQYPASKLITTGEMDCLNQFGALVTNGQEELASLAYLITMAFNRANGTRIDRLGGRFQRGLEGLAQRHEALILAAEGLGHLAAIHFHGVERAKEFAARLNASCVDVSTQCYKANCPPAALVKPPIIASEAVLDGIVARMDGALREMEEERV